jgi:hypothetical protein
MNILRLYSLSYVMFNYFIKFVLLSTLFTDESLTGLLWQEKVAPEGADMV